MVKYRLFEFRLFNQNEKNRLFKYIKCHVFMYLNNRF